MATSTDRPDLVGRTLGSYRLLKALGVGGMGAVYLGEHQSIGKKAAIKVLHREIAANAEVVQRFFNEARAVNQIGHPGIIDVFDFGDDPEVGAYLVMDLLEGEPLSERLAREPLLPRATAARIVVRIASALQAAHDAGIVHRDLKPDNVFLVPDPDHPGEERVVLLDFGIAKLEPKAQPGGSEQRTQTGMLLGTPRYMSPEQCHGAKALDHRTDVYALGVLAYELFCGRAPFVHDGLGRLMSAHMLEAPPAPRQWVADLPQALELALLCALDKDPGARFANIAALGNAVAAAVGIPHTQLTSSRSTGASPSTVDPLAATHATPQALAGGPPTPVPATLTPVPATLATGPGAVPGPTSAPTPVPATQLNPGSPSGAGKRRALSLIVVLLVLGAGGGVVAWLALRGESPDPAVGGASPPAKGTAGDGGARKVSTAPDLRTTPDASLVQRCAGGDLRSCQRCRLETPAQRTAAAELWTRACERNKVAAACLQLGVLATKQRKPKQMRRRYRQACELSLGAGCDAVAHTYPAGSEQAKSWRRRACKLGLKTACGR